jgi:hypothetical protein
MRELTTCWHDRGQEKGISIELGAGKFLAGRRVFVTGATGFLGSWMVGENCVNGAFVVGDPRPAKPASHVVGTKDRDLTSR